MNKRVKIYSTPTCPFCIRVKQFLKESAVSFEDIDVSMNHEAAEEKIGRAHV